VLIVSTYLCIGIDAMEGVSRRMDYSSEDEVYMFPMFEDELNIVKGGEIDDNEEGELVGILLLFV
jgi:hypothetical protein